jgi:hypothetical protein
MSRLSPRSKIFRLTHLTAHLEILASLWNSMEADNLLRTLLLDALETERPRLKTANFGEFSIPDAFLE